MFKNEYPVFLRMHLLKIEMLENLRDFPRDIMNVYYQNYSDGILTGCEVKVRGQKLVIGSGMILYQQRVYVLSEEVEIAYQASESRLYLKIKFADVQNDIEQVRYLTQLVLDSEVANQRDELELGNFLVREGFELRDEYVDLADFATAYNTLNRIAVRYAGEQEGTVWPELLRCYVREVMRYELKDSVEVGFCMGVLQACGKVARSVVVMYLNCCLGEDKEFYSNEEIYEGLLRVLADKKCGNGLPEQKKSVNRPMLLI